MATSAFLTHHLTHKWFSGMHTSATSFIKILTLLKYVSPMCLEEIPKVQLI